MPLQIPLPICCSSQVSYAGTLEIAIAYPPNMRFPEAVAKAIARMLLEVAAKAIKCSQKWSHE